MVRFIRKRKEFFSNYFLRGIRVCVPLKKKKEKRKKVSLSRLHVSLPSLPLSWQPTLSHLSFSLVDDQHHCRLSPLTLAPLPVASPDRVAATSSKSKPLGFVCTSLRVRVPLRFFIAVFGRLSVVVFVGRRRRHRFHSGEFSLLSFLSYLSCFRLLLRWFVNFGSSLITHWILSLDSET